MRVGFIGLGHQGAPIARRIIGGGFHTTLWARRAETLEPFDGSGASIAATARDLAAAVDLVEVCVVNDADVEQVLAADDGVLAGARPGTVVAIHSTVHPDTCRRMGERAASRAITVIDAPVSGSAVAADAGTLLVMVGGDTATVEACRPVFSTFGHPIIHVGPLGTAQLAKLVNNVLLTANMSMARDAVVLGEALGLDPDKLGEVLEHGTGRSYGLGTWLSVRPSVGSPTTAGTLLRKDVDLLAESARAAGADAGALVTMANRVLTVLGTPPSPTDSATDEAQ